MNLWNESMSTAASHKEGLEACERSLQQIKRDLENLPEEHINGIVLLISYEGVDDVTFMGAGLVDTLLSGALATTLERTGKL